MSADIVNDAVDFAARAVQRIGQILTEPRAFEAITSRLGWALGDVPEPAAALAPKLAAVQPAVERARTTDAPQDWATLIVAVGEAAAAIDALKSESFGSELDALGFGAAIARQLVTWAVIDELDRSHPRILGALRATGIVRARWRPAAGGRPEHTDERISGGELGALLSSPSSLLRAAWGWGDPTFDGAAMLDELAAAARHFGLDAGWVAEPPGDQELVDGPVGSIRWHLVVRLLQVTTETGYVELGLRFVPFGRGPEEPALIIVPYIEGAADLDLELAPGLRLEVSGAGGAQRGLLLTPESIDVIDDPLGVGEPTGVGVTIALIRSADEVARSAGDAATISTSGWRLEAGAAGGESGADAWLELALRDPHIGLSSAESGFLGSALGDQPVVTPAPITIGVSARRGVYLGPKGLSRDVGIAVDAGPLQLRDLRLELAGNGDRIAARALASATAVLGPVTVSLREMGAQLEVGFPGSGGNLGPVDLRATVVSPAGAAIAIDTAVARGGGAVEHVAGRDYRGALKLEVFGIGVTAFAVLDDTAVNRGSFAALAAARFPSIQLGWGFTLDGIGGMIAIHRRADDDRIRTDLAKGSASKLLDFDPPAADLAARVDNLAAVFPPHRGRHVVGPSFRLGWGTPTIARAELALLIEMPAPQRVLLLGAIQLGLPTLDRRVVDLRLDVAGVVDLGRGTLAIDAALHDSKIAGFDLTGDMALRAGWRDDPQLLLAIGGFHPRFAVPAGFPSLRRIALTSGDNPQLRLSAYLALTTNTAQIGARINLTASGGRFSLEAQFGFDALFELSPFRFDVEIVASASISWRGHRLLGVDLELRLTGPRPWHAKGHASFGVLWWDVTVGFDRVWGGDAPEPLPAPPDLASLLRTALGRDEAWTAQLPAGERSWLSLVPGTAVHPLADLVVRQQAVPLDTEITAFASVAIQARRLSIASVRVGARAVIADAVTDLFAPGQFARLSADQRLVAPSFERFHSGVRISSPASSGPVARTTMEVHTIVVDPLAPVLRPADIAVLSAPTLEQILINRPSRPRPPAARRGPRVREIEWVLVSSGDLEITAHGAALAAGATTYAALREILRRAPQTDRRRLLIVPRIEATNSDARVVAARPTDNLGNAELVDTVTGRRMTRAVFAEALAAGDYLASEEPES